MALNATRIISKNFLTCGNNATKHLLVNNNCQRFLFSKALLGLTGYEAARKNQLKYFANLEDSFRQRMNDFIQKEDSVIFSEDLKAMLHIAENNKADIELMMKMIKLYQSQKTQLRFSNFSFGPVVMRTFYYLDLPDEALQMWNDPENDTFFNQLMSCQILMDLLYNHKRYQDCLDVYDAFDKKVSDGVVFGRNISLLAMAACYQLNTEESFQKGLNILKDSDKKGIDLPRKALLLLGELAVKQNASHLTIEIVSRSWRRNYIATRSLKIKAFAELGRFNDILLMLKRNRNGMDETFQQRFYKDCVEAVENAITKAGLTSDSEISVAIQMLREKGGVEDKTLYEYLTSEIENNKVTNMQNDVLRHQRRKSMEIFG